MAYTDAVEAGVGIDSDKRACHMFIKSGLTDDQINHIMVSFSILTRSDHRHL